MDAELIRVYHPMCTKYVFPMLILIIDVKVTDLENLRQIYA